MGTEQAPRDNPDNPLIGLVMEFQDGTRIRWLIAPPLPQLRAMAGMGMLFAVLKLPKLPEIELPSPEER